MQLNESFGNVELHVHLDGAFRLETLVDIAHERGLSLPKSTHEEFKHFVTVRDRTDLRGFLQNFVVCIPVIAGDKSAVGRVASEFIEDCAKSKICYVEARFCPQLLSGPGFSCDAVVETVLDVLQRRGRELGVQSRLILAGIRENAEWSEEVLELAQKYHAHGVVAIDAAGDEQLSVESGGTHAALVKIFREAERTGIHRTVHAGENGPAAAVKEAVYEMHAERVGHGYHVLDDPVLYAELKTRGTHFETCPLSSWLTSSVPADLSQHPVHTFAADHANYSISTDDPMITGNLLTDEYMFCVNRIGLPPWEIARANFNAAKSSFLESEEKQELVQHLRRFYNAC